MWAALWTAWWAVRGSKGITERPHTRSGVAAFMSADSKTPYITPSMDFYSGKGVVRGRRGQQLGVTLWVVYLLGPPNTCLFEALRLDTLVSY